MRAILQDSDESLSGSALLAFDEHSSAMRESNLAQQETQPGRHEDLAQQETQTWEHDDTQYTFEDQQDEALDVSRDEGNALDVS